MAALSHHALRIAMSAERRAAAVPAMRDRFGNDKPDDYWRGWCGDLRWQRYGKNDRRNVRAREQELLTQRAVSGIVSG